MFVFIFVVFINFLYSSYRNINKVKKVTAININGILYENKLVGRHFKANLFKFFRERLDLKNYGEVVVLTPKERLVGDFFLIYNKTKPLNSKLIIYKIYNKKRYGFLEYLEAIEKEKQKNRPCKLAKSNELMQQINNIFEKNIKKEGTFLGKEDLNDSNLEVFQNEKIKEDKEFPEEIKYLNLEVFPEENKKKVNIEAIIEELNQSKVEAFWNQNQK
jgi:hypothetical protein